MSFRIRTHNRPYLDFWNARMCKANTEPLYDKIVIAILKQQGFTDLPYVPRNIYDPESLYDALMHYKPEESPFVDMKDPKVKAGIGMAFKCFAKPKGEPKIDAVNLGLNHSYLFRVLDIKGDKSAGLTAYGQSKAEAWPTGLLKAGQTLRNERSPEPCLAGVRTQEGKTGRLVWGYPLSMTILEALVARPLLTKFKGGKTPMAFAMTSVDLGIKMRKAQAHNSHYVSMDASRFDTTISQAVIKCAFNAFKTWFDLEQKVYREYTVEDLFNLIEDYFIHTPIVMPHENGPLLYSGKRHGVPSGSYFTQLVDSFANVVMLGTLDFNYKLGIRLDEVFVLGDDLLFFTKKKLSLDGMSSLLNATYGMLVNAKKSETGLASKPIPFLGRVWKHGLPTRQWQDVLKRSIAPERYRDYGDNKLWGARSVIASYGLSAMIEGIPEGFDVNQNIAAATIKDDWSSGLIQFLMREGHINKSFKFALY